MADEHIHAFVSRAPASDSAATRFGLAAPWPFEPRPKFVTSCPAAAGAGAAAAAGSGPAAPFFLGAIAPPRDTFPGGGAAVLAAPAAFDLAQRAKRSPKGELVGSPAYLKISPALCRQSARSQRPRGARWVPYGPGEAMGPVGRGGGIPGRGIASERYALFCCKLYNIVVSFVT